MSETANHTVDITDQCVRQLIFYLHATSLLDGIRPDDLAKTHETLKLLAKEAGARLFKDRPNRFFFLNFRMSLTVPSFCLTGEASSFLEVSLARFCNAR